MDGGWTYVPQVTGLDWIFDTPLLNRAEHHGFLFLTNKIRVVTDFPWCWEAVFQWPSFDPRQVQIGPYRLIVACCDVCFS